MHPILRTRYVPNAKIKKIKCPIALNLINHAYGHPILTIILKKKYYYE